MFILLNVSPFLQRELNFKKSKRVYGIKTLCAGRGRCARAASRLSVPGGGDSLLIIYRCNNNVVLTLIKRDVFMLYDILISYPYYFPVVGD